MSLKGIDISNWQSGIDLSAVKADFVIIKSSEGIGWTDPSFKKLFAAAKKTGKKLGVYHFARPTADNDPVKEAESFLNIIKPEGVIGNAILVLDWEAENQQNTAWAKKWLDKVYAETKVKPLMYMSESVTKAHDWSAVVKGGYELWVAKYRDNIVDYNYDMSSAGTKPAVKHWSNYVMWQWTSSGRLDGYAANLDCNEFYGTTADWDKLAGKSSSSGGGSAAPEKPKDNGYKAPGKTLTPQQWYNMTYGQGYNVDGAYGNQCWDYFAYFVKYFGLGLNVHCANTGYVGDLWDLRNTYGYSKHFEFITSSSKLQNGDWVIWPRGSSACPYSHVAMYWNGAAVGQNQGGRMYVCTANIQFSQMAGAFRWKGWSSGSSSSTPTDLSKYTDEQLADMVIAGQFGNGEDRVAALGSRYTAVQKIVNQKLNGTYNKKSNETIAREVIQGLWGNGEDRKKRLTAAGYNYNTIQNLVNQMVGGGSSSSSKKSNETIAREVIAGQWGNGDDRKRRLTAAGYNYNTIQSIVNQLLAGGSASTGSGIRVGARCKIRSGARDLNTGTTYAAYVYNTVYTIKSISGTRVVFGTASGITGAVSISNIYLV